MRDSFFDNFIFYLKKKETQRKKNCVFLVFFKKETLNTDMCTPSGTKIVDRGNYGGRKVEKEEKKLNVNFRIFYFYFWIFIFYFFGATHLLTPPQYEQQKCARHMASLSEKRSLSFFAHFFSVSPSSQKKYISTCYKNSDN